MAKNNKKQRTNKIRRQTDQIRKSARVLARKTNRLLPADDISITSGNEEHELSSVSCPDFTHNLSSISTASNDNDDKLSSSLQSDNAHGSGNVEFQTALRQIVAEINNEENF